MNTIPLEKPFKLEMSHPSVIAVISLLWAGLIIQALVLGFAISQINAQKPCQCGDRPSPVYVPAAPCQCHVEGE